MDRVKESVEGLGRQMTVITSQAVALSRLIEREPLREVNAALLAASIEAMCSALAPVTAQLRALEDDDSAAMSLDGSH